MLITGQRAGPTHGRPLPSRSQNRTWHGARPDGELTALRPPPPPVPGVIRGRYAWRFRRKGECSRLRRPPLRTDELVRLTWPHAVAVDTERFSSLDLAGLKDVDGFGQLPGAPWAAAEFAQDTPVFELGVGARSPGDRSWAWARLASF